MKLTPRERTVDIAEEFGQKSKRGCEKISEKKGEGKKVFGTGLQKRQKTT